MSGTEEKKKAPMRVYLDNVDRICDVVRGALAMYAAVTIQPDYGSDGSTLVRVWEDDIDISQL